MFNGTRTKWKYFLVKDLKSKKKMKAELWSWKVNITKVSLFYTGKNFTQFQRLLKLSFEDILSKLLPGARLSDSGNVKCIATNLLGKAASTAQLMIEGTYLIYNYNSKLHKILCNFKWYNIYWIYTFTASPRFDVPQNYKDGLIFRHDEVVRLKIPLIAKPPPRVTFNIHLMATKSIKSCSKIFDCSVLLW